RYPARSVPSPNPAGAGSTAARVSRPSPSRPSPVAGAASTPPSPAPCGTRGRCGWTRGTRWPRLRSWTPPAAAPPAARSCDSAKRDNQHVCHWGVRPGLGPGHLAPAPRAEGVLRRRGRRPHGQRRAFLGPPVQDEVVQVPSDALPPPGRADQQVGERERPPGVLGGHLVRERGGQLPPPRGRRSQRHPGGKSDQVAAVPGLGEDETGLPPLDGEPARVVIVAGLPVRRVGADLGVQPVILLRVRGRLPAVEQAIGEAVSGQRHRQPMPCYSSMARSSAASRSGSATTSIWLILSPEKVKASAISSRPRGAMIRPGAPLTRAIDPYLARAEAALAPPATAAAPWTVSGTPDGDAVASE